MKPSRIIRQFIAALVLVAFFGLIQATSMPLGAADTSAGIASPNDTPGSVEKTGTTPKVEKKSPLVPILIGVAAAAVIAVVLIFVVFKSTTYDIRGTWTVNWAWTGTMNRSRSGVYNITFTGSLESGTFTDDYGDTGNYTVDGKNVNWTLGNFPGEGFTWRGAFSEKEKMNGTMEWQAEGESGTWTAILVNAAFSKKPAETAPIVPWKKN